MSEVITSVEISAKACRDERFDILKRKLEGLCADYITKTNKEVYYNDIPRKLEAAGARRVPSMFAGEYRMQLRGLVTGGVRTIKLSILDDGSMKVEKLYV